MLGIANGACNFEVTSICARFDEVHTSVANINVRLNQYHDSDRGVDYYLQEVYLDLFNGPCEKINVGNLVAIGTINDSYHRAWELYPIGSSITVYQDYSHEHTFCTLDTDPGNMFWVGVSGFICLLVTIFVAITCMCIQHKQCICVVVACSAIQLHLYGRFPVIPADAQAAVEVA